MSLLEIFIWLILLALLLPPLVYLCCKLGTYGALKGKRLFDINHPKIKESEYGESS